jgi:hypothetical protein
MTDYAVIPNFGQLIEYITQGPLVGGVYGVVINRVKLEDIINPIGIDGQSLNKTLILQGVVVDYAKVNAISTARVPTLTPAELTPVKAIITADNHLDMVKYITDTTPTALIITSKLVEVASRPMWAVGLNVTIGQIYKYIPDKNLYQVVQAHTTQSDWTPPVCKALWKRFYEPTDAPWPWVQPIGSVDAYPIGAKVTYGGYTWQNTIAANVWQPGVTGWTNLTPPTTLNWAAGVAYKVNDRVVYVPNGFTYKCLQAHTSIATWNPPAAVSLWVKV